MSTEVSYTQQGQIGYIRFASDDGINLLSVPIMASLEARLDEIEQSPNLRVLIITGEGRTFIAGADIDEMARASGDEGRAFSQRGQRFMNRLAHFKHAVTIAAINGSALGGGFELALACDLRVMAENALIGFPEVSLGLIPGWGGTQRAFALIGPARVRRMLLTGERINAKTAFEIGLANECVPLDQLMIRAEALAKGILANGPSAVRLAKHVLCAHEAAWLERGFAGEAECFGKAFINEESREGLRAFLEKRTPSWAASLG
ncbi:MAG: enoyl-CoA hydratase/isomerase family protein [Planctomycetia bacterium]|jgi:enoyl-CoA hydratase|nr:enoyl-CoA hydratase/isomerase family protein [Planctomycetia bacterium]MCC7314164.1 enoyl-CoA hydratase/isomerase family protein [Planctomycetota bacterium]OQZ05324.1 MAG: hypothetical protein B6D36_10710 [Planctomycetes bacterium UTPLA1]